MVSQTLPSGRQQMADTEIKGRRWSRLLRKLTDLCLVPKGTSGGSLEDVQVPCPFPNEELAPADQGELAGVKSVESKCRAARRDQSLLGNVRPSGLLLHAPHRRVGAQGQTECDGIARHAVDTRCRRRTRCRICGVPPAPISAQNHGLAWPAEIRAPAA